MPSGISESTAKAFAPRINKTDCTVEEIADRELKRFSSAFDSVNTHRDISFRYKHNDYETFENVYIGTIGELIDDWNEDKDFCPSDNTFIYAIEINSEPSLYFACLRFGDMMNALNSFFKEDDADTESISLANAEGVHMTVAGVEVLVKLHLYQQEDCEGKDRPGIAIQLYLMDGTPWVTLTTSLGEFISIKNGSYVDENNVFPDIIKTFENAGYMKKTLLTKSSGFYQYPLYVFDEDFLKKAGKESYEIYEASYKDAMSF